MDFRQLSASLDAVGSVACDALLVVVAGEKADASLDASLRRALDDAVAHGDFELKRGKTIYLHRPQGVKAARLVFAACGAAAPKSIKAAFAAGISALKGGGAKHVAVALAGAGEVSAEHAEALVAELERRGALANTIVVITADHGEEFGGRGIFGHGTSLYGPVLDEGHEIPAVPWRKIPPQFLRQYVADPTGQPPGTVVVDTADHFLYVVQPGGQALRYGVGLGRAGFEWAGNAVVQYKRKWPRWTPPDSMIGRQPELEKYSVRNGGMDPGLTNPLGARALDVSESGGATLCRLHGSPEWSSIGKSVSSGCVRLINQDVLDLYERVPNRSPVLVTSGIGAPMVAMGYDKAIPIDAGVPEAQPLGRTWF